MCGICGIYHFDGTAANATVLAKMVHQIEHRGPDDHGTWVEQHIGIANARLAILDISAAGHQPMADATQSTWIAYNGEVYNHLDIRQDLAGAAIPWQSGADTETLLYAYKRWGVEFLTHLNGMFALSLWDVATQTLLLARDRLGQKPLYYYRDANKLIFGSEIKCILAHPDVDTGFNQSLLGHYFTYGYVPAPDTLFRNIHMLPPGALLRIDQSGIEMRQWWTAPTNSTAAYIPSAADYATQEAALSEQLKKAVKARMLSDVPVGAFLSGGIDSSLIVALMREYTSETVKTFAIGFEDSQSFDETPYAQTVADHLGTEHQTFIVPAKAVDLIDKLAWHLDQPFGDSSAIPTYLVSKHTRQHVTVALTGDGGDELFAGYDRFRAARIADLYKKVPTPIHALIQRGIGLLPVGNGYRNIVRRAGEFTATARLPLSDRYLGWVGISAPEFASALTNNSQSAAAIRQHYANYFGAIGTDPIPPLLDVNLKSYLPDDLLIKTDRMSMAASLEARSPFLDYNLVEFAAQLPMCYKLKGKQSKYILRTLAKRYVPAHIIDRPKHGFGVPVGKWFRGNLKDYLQDHLISAGNYNSQYLNHAMVQQLVKDHLAEKQDHGHLLWTLLSFEIWLRKFNI